ncbi:PLC-like phosphodiesterase [Cytidiella melzeri]|nr:PLC-like phosphodiesterase [Cytidiella melzeri]
MFNFGFLPLLAALASLRTLSAAPFHPLGLLPSHLNSRFHARDSSAMVCNGHKELCDRSYGNITFMGAHDSFAFSQHHYALARDQQVDIPSQLALGVRLLQAQSHMHNRVLHFCHTNCFDGGSVQDYLTIVNTFMRANPHKVLTLILTNPEGVSIPDVWAPAFVKSGISDIADVPPNLPVAQKDWPTLREFISSGKRVIVFLDHGAEINMDVPYILPEFDMIWETPFSVTDPSFPCSVDRIEYWTLQQNDHMYMINHSLNNNVLHSGVILTEPNHASNKQILAHARNCAHLAAGRAPNCVLLDFVNLGQGLQAVNMLNGL